MASGGTRGLYDTADFESGIKKLDIRDKIYELQPEAAPFMTVLSKMSKFRAVDTEFKWFEDDLLGNYTQLNMAGNAASTILVLVVDDATIFQEGDVIKCLGNSEECILVRAVDDNQNQITVTRGWGSTAAGTINNNDYLYKLGSAQAEGYTVPESLVTTKVPKTNYTQVFSKSVTITNTAEGVETYGGNRRNFERNKKAIELKREMEAQFIWGEPKEDTTGGSEPRRQTGGVYNFLSTTAPSLDMSSSALTESAFEGWLKDVFTYSGDDRMLFAGPLVISQISQFASGKQRLEPGVQTVYGVKVTTYLSALGRVHLVLDRHFLGPHAGKGLCLDVKQMVYRYLAGNNTNQDLALTLNTQPNNARYKQDEWSATIGLEMRHALLHGHLLGVA